MIQKPLLPRLCIKARAIHRLARRKRWPAYAFAAAIQEFPHEIPHEIPHHDQATLMIHAVHMYLVYLTFTLID
jgi:hypothetical protein